MRRALVVALAALASACSLVIGTKSYTLGPDASDDGGGDETSTDDVSDGGGPIDDGEAGCAPALGCYADASVCGTACGVTSANCVAACKTQTCKNGCASTETACRNNCSATCYACTVGASCPDQAGCDDAAAK